MEDKTANASQSNEVQTTPLNEMDVGLLERGNGLLPIVGLGASAGGIEALKEFLTAMPVDSGMAFVVIMHLSPTHESTLPRMFQHATTMPVVVATDGALIEPNSVYVIPPGKFLGASRSHLRLTNAEEYRGKRVAVDFFFRTLAETHGAQALAVVLSGAGGDGALGLKRVKEVGGLAIAQDPDEAQHPDMPRAAIATGVVDWVLQVKEMPAKLIAYVKRREELTLPAEDGPHPAAAAELTPDEHEAALRDVLAFLHMRTGRDFSFYKRATIVRRIARRIQVNALVDLPGYLVYLRTHAGEAGALLKDLLISVTNFFRDPPAFAALERTIPQLFEGKEASDTVRVWVPGCATGEEAYSIAILLCEYARTLVGPPQLQIFATDLDEEVIREAREGLYPETIAADVSEERLRHFFIHEQGGYRVRRAVRELVLFAPHDLMKDSPFSRLDLISCRNLLIYLNRSAQNRAFDIFHFALRPGGRLFLGTSEAVDDSTTLFAVVDKKQRLYVQRPGPRRLIAVPAGPGTLARALALQERTRERPAVPARASARSVQTGLDRGVPLDSGLPAAQLHYRLIERFSPPSILVNSMHDIVHLSESAGRFLQFPGGEPTRNLLRIVQPMLRVELRAALYAAARTHTTAMARGVPFELGDAQGLVDIRVTPADDIAPSSLLVVFDEHPVDAATVVAPRGDDFDQTALHLERELVATKAHLRDTIEESEASTEELKASNEELQAMNEELRSATEELETSREELQSINEELRTVNDELKSNVDQLARSNNDLQNLMAATDIATVFLDRELRIQRFTPSARSLFNFISTDLGRPLADLSRQLDYPDIVADAERSLAFLQPNQREVSAGDRWYIARTIPYRTGDDQVAGVVLTFLDITEQKAAEAEIARLAVNSERQRQVYETVLNNTPDFVYVFSLDHRVLYANDSLVKTWGRDREGVIGKTFLEIGYEPWHAAMHDREIDEVRATRSPIRGEVPFTGTNGRREYEYIFVPLIGANGEVEAVAGTTRDVTARKEAEQRVLLREERQTFLVRLADTLRDLSNPMDVQAEASRLLGEHLRANRVLYFEICDGQYVIEREYTFGVRPVAGRYPVADFGPGLLNALMDNRTFIEIDATAGAHRPALERDAFAAIQVRAHVNVPLVKGGNFLAGMTVQFSERHDWTSDEVALIEETAERTWAAVEQVRAETALRRSEERWGLVRSSSGVGTWYCDLPFDVLQWDDVVKAHFHLPPDAIVTIDTFYGRLHPDDREPTRLAIERSIAERSHYDVDFRTADPATGTVRWVHAIGRTFYAADGTPTQFDGVTLDVSEQKRAEASLRESEQRFRLAADAAPVLIWLSGIDKLCHWFNQPWLAFTGRSIDQEVGNGWLEGVHPDDFERCLQTYSASFDARTPFSMEYRLRRHDGEYRWLIDNGVPRYGSDGEFDGYIGSCLDVTDYKNAEAGLRDADRRKDEFLATLAHELRNPLAPISNGLQVIRIAEPNGTIEQVRSMMERQLTQLVRLVDDLLDVSRVTSGKVELRVAPVEMRAVIEAAVETSRPSIEEAGHQFTLNIPDQAIWVNGDMTRLAQVVSNLLTNSAKYTRRGGHIRMAVRREGEVAVLSVADDGVGIPTAMLEKVFDMFAQVDRALEKTTGGLSIGLSLAKGLVEMHGGTVEARSDGEGFGSEFVVRLPALLGAIESVPPVAAPEKEGPYSRRRILVADDNVDSAQSLGKLLELLGNDVSTAHDGLQAVSEAETWRPEVILLDIGMPKLNGYEAARRIRANSWGQSTVLVALTGWGQEANRNDSAEAGFDHHLVKPVEIAVLQKLLAGLKTSAQ